MQPIAHFPSAAVALTVIPTRSFMFYFKLFLSLVIKTYQYDDIVFERQAG